MRGKREIIGGEWPLAYDHFDPSEEGLREALTSAGNGYFCTRGAAEWADSDGAHYPGTYTHGGYDRETTILAGRPTVNEDLVNLPNWLVLKLVISAGDEAGLVGIARSVGGDLYQAILKQRAQLSSRSTPGR